MTIFLHLNNYSLVKMNFVHAETITKYKGAQIKSHPILNSLG